MADMFNFNTGDSSNGFNNAYPNPAVNNQNINDVDYKHNWHRTPRPFGLNVRVPQNPQPLIGENTEALIKKTFKELFLAPIKEIENFFEKYEKVFSGEVQRELKSLYVQRFNTAAILQGEDEEVFGTSASKFLMDM